MGQIRLDTACGAVLGNETALKKYYGFVDKELSEDYLKNIEKPKNLTNIYIINYI